MSRSRRLSVAVVVAAVLVAVTTLVLGAFGVLDYRARRSDEWTRLRTDTAAETERLAVALALPVWNIDRTEIDRVIESAGADPAVTGVWVNAAGRVHGRTRNGGRLLSVETLSPTPGELSFNRPITFGGERIGSVRLVATPRFIEVRLRRALVRGALAVLAVDLVLIAGVYVVLWLLVLRPLVQVEAYASAVSTGESAAAPAGTAWTAELERLRSSIEQMVGLLDLRYEMLSKVFRSNPALTVVAKADGEIVDANDALLETFGLRRDDVLGRTSVDLGLWSQDERDAFVAELRRVGRIRHRPTTFTTRRGRRTTIVSAELLEIGGATYSLVMADDVTERQLAEETFAKVFRSSPAAISVSELETGRLIDVNDVFARTRGYERAELIGRTTLEAGIWRTPENRERFVEALRRDGSVHDLIVLAPTRSGDLRSLLVSAERIEVDGTPCVIAMSQDVTDRLVAERRLRESEERWRRLSEATFEGIAITENGMMRDANEQLASMLGYSLPELLGRPVLELVAPESQAEVRQRITERSVGPYEHAALAKDGTHVPVEVRARVFEEGDSLLRVSAIRDVTERKRLEADLRRAAQEWNECFDAMPAGLLIADETGGVRRANRPILELAGRRDVESLVSRPIDAIGDNELWSTLMRLAVDRASPVPDELHDSRTGTAWRVAMSDFPRGPGEPPWSVFVIRDVTETVRLREDLQRQQTLAQVGSLVAGVAHEVRTPLFGISATLDAFEGGTPEELDECTDLLRAQVKRLSNLMSDLLDYGRPPGLQIEHGGINEVVTRAVASCAPLATEAGVEVRAVLPLDALTCDRDARRLEQAVQNLVANAVQHAPRGSEVRVTVEAVRRSSGETIECRVADSGSGIPAESLPRLFDPFFSRRKGGTGLGLSIVQRIAEAHGGRVSARNRTEGGAEFVLALPVRAEEGGSGRA